MRMCAKLIAITGLLLLPAIFASADTKVLRLVSSSGSKVISGKYDAPISVEVRVDNAATVAAAAFTVTYDTTNLTLRTQNPITSSFFGTFVQQNLLTDPADVTVPGDTTRYYSPLVNNAVSRGTMIAAARIENGSAGEATIFTLYFELSGSPGTYPISIVPTVLSNTDAGYSASGEAIPLLVGIGTDDYPAHTVATPIKAYLVVDGPFADTDSDGIDDAWEGANVPAGTRSADELKVYTATGDYDKDGYTDLQEYLNRGELDPDGNLYDPEVDNAQDGTGYSKTAVMSGTYLLLTN